MKTRKIIDYESPKMKICEVKNRAVLLNGSPFGSNREEVIDGEDL